MSSPAEPPSFAVLDARVRAAVESIAATDPSPSDPFRGLYITDDIARSLARSGSVEGFDDRLAEAARRLGLDSLETAVLGLCAAPELSPHYGRLFAYLHDDVTRKLASPRLVARLLSADGVEPGDVLARLDEGCALRSTYALEILAADEIPLAERGIKVADRLAAYLLGSRLDSPEDVRVEVVPVPTEGIGREDAVGEVRALLGGSSTLPLAVAGNDAKLVLASALGRPLLVVWGGELLSRANVAALALAARLEDRALCYEGLEAAPPHDRDQTLRALAIAGDRPLVCVSSREDASRALGEGAAVVVEVPSPSFADRRVAWAGASGSADVEEAAAKFRLSLEQIAEASEVAVALAHARGLDTPGPAELNEGAREASRTRLSDLAERLEPAFGREDLVLPDRQREVLQSVSAYLRHRDLVLSEWGYERTVARDQGIKVLFAGESGTGKTMAAQVLARELGLDIYRIDLATVVSKYIGETEKNLDRIFSAAEGSNAVLFCDEADAIFGKRSEVRDAHDRYANVEVAYLLQRMETYPGAVILATNLRQNVDDAFLRRLDFVIDFPFPERADRERIWRRLLPATAPIAEDVDIPFLARQFRLSGGSIRNVSLAAAFMAADDGGVIGMPQLVRGVALEYEKHGRLVLETDFERFRASLPR
jgi:ATPase family associated with various cellular activities (AAA)